MTLNQKGKNVKKVIEELEEMVSIVAESMREGAFGLSTGLFYVPGAFATTEEVVRSLAKSGDELMFYTFGAHPMACAAADAVLAIVEREREVAAAGSLWSARPSESVSTSDDSR